jgi:hypothetical protein
MEILDIYYYVSTFNGIRKKKEHYVKNNSKILIQFFKWDNISSKTIY